jgi:Domain of unknown function (DUF4252)
MSRFALLSAAGLALTGPAQAQGYFTFGEIPGVDAKPNVQIDLNPAMLGFVRGVVDDSDPETAKVLAGITNMRVYVYEDLGDNAKAVLKFVDDTSDRLERDGWSPAVRINDDDEQVRIFMKVDPAIQNASSSVSGITLMVTDGDDEAVFINIAGKIEAAQLGKIMGSLDIEGVGKIDLGGVKIGAAEK